MARIIVLADGSGDASGARLYEERVGAIVLENAHASAQLLERLAWAVAYAEAAESASSLRATPEPAGSRR